MYYNFSCFVVWGPRAHALEEDPGQGSGWSQLLPVGMEISQYFNNFCGWTEAYWLNVNPGQLPPIFTPLFLLTELRFKFLGILKT